MEQDWPQLPTYSKGYLKREKLLKEKTLVDVKKRVKQTERMIKPAVENATAVSSTAKHAQESTDAVSKVGYAETHMYSKNKSVIFVTLVKLKFLCMNYLSVKFFLLLL